VAEAGRAIALAIACAFAAHAADAAPQTHTVVIEGMRFNPETLAVHRGDRIVWRNEADGNALRLIPVSLNAQASSGQPPVGGRPYGTSTTPEASLSLPSVARV
jgi:hypothetical protein